VDDVPTVFFDEAGEKVEDRVVVVWVGQRDKSVRQVSGERRCEKGREG
jgi:hypothetical protein